MKLRAWGAGVGLCGWLLLWGCSTSEPPALGEIPHPDLSGSEPGVQEQIGAERDRLERMLAAGEAGEDELAEGFGRLGMLYHAYELREAALACYAHAARLSPGTFRWPYYTGHLQRRAGDEASAAAAFGQVLELHPGHVPTLVQLGQVEIDANRLDEAEELFWAALDIEPDTAAAHLGLGRIAVSRKNFDDAIEELTTALGLAPGASEIHYPLGLAYRGQGDAERAEEFLALRGDVRAEVYDPEIAEVLALAQSAQTLQTKGVSYYREGRYEEAVEQFHEAVQRAPEDAGAHTNLALALIQLGRVDEARRELETATSLDPGDPNARYNLGTLYAETGLDERAVSEFEAVIQVGGEQADVYFNLGNALRRLVRFEDSLAPYRQAVEIDPAHADARLGEALALIRLHRYADARRRLEQARQALPDHVEIQHVLMRVVAAAPEDSVRDGDLAAELAARLSQGRVPFRHVVALGMVAAENGFFKEAIKIQEGAITVARRTGNLELLGELEANLARYRKGQPCRRPWADDDPLLSPRPAATTSTAAGS